MIIPARFNGPPASAHGGYSAGLLGTTFDGPAEVTLLAPPPLETELVCVDGTLRHGERVIATARAATFDVGRAPQLTLDAVRAAMPDPDELRKIHPFPTCYGCGPDRAPGDGLRLFAGRIAGDLWGCTWTPEGAVTALDVWAALDCPSSTPAQDPTGARPIVLGRFAVDAHSDVPAGEELAILTAPLEHDGRKRTNAVWLVDAAGRELAAARATWIELKPDDAAQRRGDGR